MILQRAQGHILFCDESKLPRHPTFTSSYELAPGQYFDFAHGSIVLNLCLAHMGVFLLYLAFLCPPRGANIKCKFLGGLASAGRQTVNINKNTARILQ